MINTSRLSYVSLYVGLVTQIKHRDLDLCIDADSSAISSNKNVTEVEAFLKPCSLSNLNSQSWTFTKPFRHSNDIAGNIIRLASDGSFYLTLKPLDSSNADDCVLVLRVSVILLLTNFERICAKLIAHQAFRSLLFSLIF